jgi:hypothetical protein
VHKFEVRIASGGNISKDSFIEFGFTDGNTYIFLQTESYLKMILRKWIVVRLCNVLWSRVKAQNR